MELKKLGTASALLLAAIGNTVMTVDKKYVAAYVAKAVEIVCKSVRSVLDDELQDLENRLEKQRKLISALERKEDDFLKLIEDLQDRLSAQEKQKND